MKMKKFKLKETSYSFDKKGMIIEGESVDGIVQVYAKDLCIINENIMTKREIMICMVNGAYCKWDYNASRLEPLEIIKITQLDYEMLKFVQKQGAKYICRDENGTLNLYDIPPRTGWENGKEWLSTGNSDYLSNFTKQLFQFVKWEDKKYYVIEDVLENYEIVED